jgi:2,4-dienoyl-CoA reductase-like NADH-dependent reductase (Old Yellow Enzyme family)
VKLLEPISVGSVELRNRVVSTAHGAFLSFYRPGEPPDRYIGYQERRAAGGTGLIILQPAQVHPSSQATGHYPYEPDDLRRKLRAMKTALHAHGAAVFMQLMHFGAEFRSDASSDFTPLWSFGGTITASGNEVAHQMSGHEIEELVDAFVRTAVLALESGIDGVELHGAHGYLIQQSFSPWANTRDDEWGEPLRFVTTILERLRAQVGSDPVVGVRLSVDDYRRPAAGGLGPEGLREVARAIVDTGHVDYLNQSSGSRSSHYARAVGSYHHPPGELLPLIAQTRQAIGARVPVVGVGRVTTPELAERALEAEQCDLVAMTRAQIADPDIVVKLRRGAADRIRPCVGANQGCVDRMVGGLAITCIHNPEVGREYQLGLVPEQAAEQRRVLVVGAGPAGLSAARTAALRGHRVALVDRRSFPGGRLGLLADCGPASALLESVRWLREELERLGVKLELAVEVDADALAERQPDVVVLATGARPAPDRVPAGDGSVPIVTVESALTDGLGSGRVLILDHIGAEEVPICAERLAAQGAAVTLATPMPTVGPYIGFTRISDQLKRLYGGGCELLTAVQFRDVREGEAVLRALHSGEERRVAVDAIVAGVPGRPELDLDAPARGLGARVLLAGDSVAPRDALRAFREGDDAGRAA